MTEEKLRSWIDKLPAIEEITKDYVKAINKANEKPSEKNIEHMQDITVALIVKVMQEYGYVPLIEDGHISGYASTNLDDLN